MPGSSLDDAAGPLGELHLVLIWHNALDQAERILADVEEHFTVSDVLRIHWSPRRFSRDLTSFYHTDLPPGSEKERHCGVGEFLLLVVEDRDPVYAVRRVSQGRQFVNTKMHAAKERYREWSGGGHRIHTTLDQPEFERDSFLLLGPRAQHYRVGASDSWDRKITDLFVDVVGMGGWDDRKQLLTATELNTPSVVMEHSEGGKLTLLTEDLWLVSVAASGLAPEKQEFARYDLTIGGNPQTVELHEVGGGHLDPDWQSDMIERRVWETEGLPVLSPEDRFYSLLYRGLHHEPGLLEACAPELRALAVEYDLPDGDFGDTRLAQDNLMSYLARMGYGHGFRRPPPVPPKPSLVERSRRAVGRTPVGSLKRTLHASGTELFRRLRRISP
jgi:hypothetical protein